MYRLLHPEDGRVKFGLTFSGDLIIFLFPLLFVDIGDGEKEYHGLHGLRYHTEELWYGILNEALGDESLPAYSPHHRGRRYPRNGPGCPQVLHALPTANTLDLKSPPVIPMCTSVRT